MVLKASLMRTSKLLALLACAVGFMASDCNPDPRPETNYEPVLIKRSELTNNLIQWQNPKPIQQPGKIYYKDNFIFINQKFDGVHVVQSLANGGLEKVGFLRIPGNLDVAIKGSTLYADNASDLIAIDLQHLLDKRSVRITKRIENALPAYLPPDNGRIPEEYKPENRPANTVIIRWKKTND